MDLVSFSPTHCSLALRRTPSYPLTTLAHYTQIHLYTVTMSVIILSSSITKVVESDIVISTIPDRAPADPCIPMLSSSPSDLRRGLCLKSRSIYNIQPIQSYPYHVRPFCTTQIPSPAPMLASPYFCDKPDSDLAFHTGW